MGLVVLTPFPTCALCFRDRFANSGSCANELQRKLTTGGVVFCADAWSSSFVHELSGRLQTRSHLGVRLKWQASCSGCGSFIRLRLVPFAGDVRMCLVCNAHPSQRGLSARMLKLFPERWQLPSVDLIDTRNYFPVHTGMKLQSQCIVLAEMLSTNGPHGGN